jgi:hypothetical protein
VRIRSRASTFDQESPWQVIAFAVLKVRLLTALTSFIAAAICVLIDRKLSMRALAGGYLGLDALFSLSAMIFYMRGLACFILPYAILTAAWLATALWLVVEYT